MALVDTSKMMATVMQPKFKFRYIMDIQGIPSALIRSVSKPQIQNSQVQLSYLNRTVYYKGRSKMSAVSITITDTIDPNMVATIQEWQLLHSDPATGIDGSKSLYAMKEVSITEIGGAGQIINKWTYHNCWLTDVNFGDLSASDDSGIGQISFTMRYDYYTVDA